VASLWLLESIGFQRWGYLPGATQMPEGRRDVVILGLSGFGNVGDSGAV
jgi:hypothetical protein